MTKQTGVPLVTSWGNRRLRCAGFERRRTGSGTSQAVAGTGDLRSPLLRSMTCWRWGYERVHTARLARRVYELGSNMTSYNATYVALAEALNCELLTGDQRLKAATGPKCAIRTLS